MLAITKVLNANLYFAIFFSIVPGLTIPKPFDMAPEYEQINGIYIVVKFIKQNCVPFWSINFTELKNREICISEGNSD